MQSIYQRILTSSTCLFINGVCNVLKSLVKNYSIYPQQQMLALLPVLLLAFKTPKAPHRLTNMFGKHDHVRD